MPPKLSAGLIKVEQQATKALMKAIQPDGYNCLQNNHLAAGQLIPHAHVHIIPRYNGDNIKLDWPHKSYDEAEITDWHSSSGRHSDQ